MTVTPQPMYEAVGKNHTADWAAELTWLEIGFMEEQARRIFNL